MLIRTFVLLIFVLFAHNYLAGQVSINTSGAAPDVSSMLDISSTTKGLLIPRMTLAEMQAIVGPASGLLVYSTTSQALYNYSGTSWGMIKSKAPSLLVDTDGNTSVDVEFSANNDMIYFRLGGSTKMILKSNRLELLNDNSNLFIGEASGQSNVTGSYNTALGRGTLYTNYHGNDNVAIGHFALYSNIDGAKNTAVGSKSLWLSIGSFNVGVGANTLYSNSSGSHNTAIGTSALYSNLIGYFNTAGGSYALYNNLENNNTAYGRYSLYSNTNGYQNTSVGSSALQNNISGINNTAFGYVAIYNTTDGDDNTAGGAAALYYNISGNNNAAFGREALRDNTSSDNTAVGYHAAMVTTSGFQNVSVGSNSLVNNTTGSFHTAIGYNTGPNTTSLANTTTLGIDATATATDMVRIGNVYVNSIGGQVSWSTVSDGRFKENIRQDVPGLSFINELRPVTYEVNRGKINEFAGLSNSSLANDPAYSSRQMTERTSGFIAQEVEASAQSMDFDFSGVDAPDNSGDYYGLRYSEFVVPLVKAVQELSFQSEQQQHIIETLIEKNRVLEGKIEAMERK